MTRARITITVPPEVLEKADQAAESQGLSRSALVAAALRAYTGRLEVREGRPDYGGPVPGVSDAPDAALIQELASRLGVSAPPLRPPQAGRALPGVGVAVDRERLVSICRRYHVRRLALFGSVLRDDFGPESDIDVLVEFEDGRTPGLEIIDLQDELASAFEGRSVDLVTERALHHRLRPSVLAEAVQLHGP